MLKVFPPLKPPPAKVTTFCDFTFRRLKIASNGNASMCCFQQRGILGNVLKEPILNIWRSPLITRAREMIVRGALPSMCNIWSCPYFYEREKLDTRMYEIEQFSSPVDFELDIPMQHCNVGGENPGPNNPACFMCERTYAFTRQEDCLDEICEVLRPFMVRAETIHIQGVAEPFWKDRLFRILDRLGLPESSPNILVSTTTNGTVFKPECQEKLLKYNRSVITCSIDAATPETYKRIRRLNAFNLVVAHLQKYSEIRKGALNVANNINLLNIDEVEKMVELAAKLRVDTVIFSPTYRVPDVCVDEQNAHLFRDAQYKILEKAKEMNVNVDFICNLCLDYLPIEHPLAKLPGCGTK